MSDAEGYPSQTQTEQLKEAPPTADGAETFTYPQQTIDSFETAKGSIYDYNEGGQTTRYKTATGEKMATQDLTVFAPLSLQQEQDLLVAYRTKNPTQETKVYVVERQPDDTATIVRSVDQVRNPGMLYLAISRDGKIAENVPATLFPKVGFNVFDTRHFKQDGTWMTERHLGNKVTKINYKEPALAIAA